MNKLPLIVTFIGTEDCNTGHVLALEDEMDNYLEEIKQTVTEAWNAVPNSFSIFFKLNWKLSETINHIYSNNEDDADCQRLF